MRALVTGGGGFLGRAITEALLARGDEVRTFARGAYPELDEMGAEHMRGDIAHLGALELAMQDIDVVFHVASLVAQYGDPADFDRINVDGTRNVIEACRRTGVTRLVFTSTPSVIHDGNDKLGIDESVPYPADFACDYFRTKAEAERLVLAADGSMTAEDQPLRTCALRPHGIFGPGDTSLLPLLIGKAIKGNLRIVGTGETKVDWTYVDNAVHAHLLAADALDGEAPAGGKAFFIANDEPTNPWTFFNGILRELGIPEVKRKVPLGFAKFAGSAAEGVWRTLKLKGEPPATRAQASVIGTSHYFDLSAARRDLGYEPQVSLDEGVKRTIPWLKQQMDEGRL